MVSMKYGEMTTGFKAIYVYFLNTITFSHHNTVWNYNTYTLNFSSLFGHRKVLHLYIHLFTLLLQWRKEPKEGVNIYTHIYIYIYIHIYIQCSYTYYYGPGLSL
jgi:hypothetical protein